MNGSRINGSRTTRPKLFAGLAIAALAAGSLVGCGDDDDAAAAPIEVSGAVGPDQPRDG